MLEQLDLLGEEVVPVLRKEFAKNRPVEVPDAPTHASLVRAKYGDAAPRQATPNANRGDNLTLGSPYQDTTAVAVVEARLGIRRSRHPEGVRAMTTKRIVVISAGLSTPSSTRQLADRLTADAAAILRERGIDVEAQVFELRDLAHDITNHLLLGFAPPKLEEALDAVSSADGLIAVTPIFSTSYAGLFKSFIDVVDPQALTDLPVLIGATGGTSASLARDRLRDSAVVHLPARDPGHDRRVRGDERLGQRRRRRAFAARPHLPRGEGVRRAGRAHRSLRPGERSVRAATARWVTSSEALTGE